MKTFAASTIATSLLLASVHAQQQYTIDPNAVSNSTRVTWCNSQQAQCPLICLQTPANSAAVQQNNCDPNSLTYSCICSDGQSPNITQFSQTLPYFICTEWGNECVSNCGSDSQCASNCRSQHPCGAQNPVRVNTSTITSSTMSATGTASGLAGATTGSDGGSSIYTGYGGSAATSGGNGAAASASAGGAASIRGAALNMGQTFGLLGVAGALFGGFAVLL